ncbi:hypothetical protein Dip510_002032 [Elusimicrobium posterum]|uniref:hypothetical protein n=1 Tax=Elusimicrobium posterum TaxID=3116653 RepID=UPI003C758617
MNYITMRWFLVKEMDKNKLETLHKVERAAYNYALWNSGYEAENKIHPPVWWQSGLNMLLEEKKDFWNITKDEKQLQKAQDFAGTMHKLLLGPGAGNTEFFNNILLMHRCDLLINTLHNAYH